MSRKKNKDETASVYDDISGRVTTAYSAARDRASSALEGTAAGIEANPAAALLGGLALGIVAAALIPRSAREIAALNPVGTRVADAARSALEAGQAAGATAFADAGLSPDKLREQARGLLDQAIKATSDAGLAALSAAHEAAAK